MIDAEHYLSGAGIVFNEHIGTANTKSGYRRADSGVGGDVGVTDAATHSTVLQIGADGSGRDVLEAIVVAKRLVGIKE